MLVQLSSACGLFLSVVEETLASGETLASEGSVDSFTGEVLA